MPSEIAGKVIDTMHATPFVLALLVINITVLLGFSYTLHEVSAAITRRDSVIEKCMR